MTPADSLDRPIPAAAVHAGRVVALYCLFAAAWFLLGDSQLASLLAGTGVPLAVGAARCWIFMAVTCALLFVLVGQVTTSAAPAAHLLRLPNEISDRRTWIVAALAIPVAAAVIGHAIYLNELREEHERLAFYAKSKGAEVAHWLREREADARVFQSSRSLSLLLARAGDGDPAARRDLLARLEELRAVNRLRGIAVADSAGVVNFAIGQLSTPPSTTSIASRADASRDVTLAVDPSPGHEGHLQLVATMPGVGGQSGPVAVLDIDAASSLNPILVEGPALHDASLALLEATPDGGLRRICAGGWLAQPEGATLISTLSLRNGSKSVGTIGSHGRVVTLLEPVAGSRLVLAIAVAQSRLDQEGVAQGLWGSLAVALALLAATALLVVQRKAQRVRSSLARQGDREARLEALELLDAIANGSTDAIFAKDSGGRYIFANREACRIFAKSSKEILGRTDNELFPAAQAQAVLENDRVVMMAGETRTFEQHLTTGIGENTYLTVKGVIHDPAGQVNGVFGVSRDISRRKQAEQDLAEERLLFESIVDTMAEGLVIIGADGRFTYANPASETILGVSRDRIVGVRHDEAPWTRLQDDGEPLPAAAHPFELMRAGRSEIRDHLMKLQRLDGTQRLIRLNARARRTAQGELRSMVATFVDETSRSEAEVKQQESEGKLRLFIENAPAAIAMFDSQMRYLAASRRWTEDYGLVGTPLIGRSHYDVSPGIPQAWKDVHTRCLAGAIESHPGDTYQRPDGSLGWLSWEARPWHHAAGEVGGLIIATEDITARVRNNEELERHRERLEELVEARTAQLESSITKLESFSYTISHDLRAPLRAIHGFASLLVEEAGDKLDAGQRQFADRIVQAALRMDRMLEEIHMYSRADRNDLRCEYVDLTPLAGEVVQDLAPVYPKARIEVGALPRVWADPTMLRQVLQNLVGNALKFSAKSPHPHIEVWSRLDGTKVEVCVRDNGVGFDMRYANQLFGMFKRLHQETDFPGTGVGLAIVKRVIERHGGAISVDSAPGEGATFRFTLEAAPGGQATA